MKFIKNPYFSVFFVLFVALAVFLALPPKAQAFDFLNPFGGGSDGFGLPLPFPAPVPVPLPIPFPDFDFDDDDCHSNCGGYSHPTYPLSVSCYPAQASIPVNTRGTWVASVHGGQGQYRYNWSGSGSLSGSGPTASKIYTGPGTKTASVTVSDGKSSKSANCGSMTVLGNNPQPTPTPTPTPNPSNNNNSNTNNNYNYNYNYNSNPGAQPISYHPPYYPPYDYDHDYTSNLTVTCYASPSYIQVGDRVTWSAFASGGRGAYSYRWTGTDGLDERGQSVSMRYYNPGQKSAWVTVTSGNQTRTQLCYNTVNVGGHQYPYPYPTVYPTPYPYPYPQYELDIACIADPKTARVNQPVNWTAEVTGGAAPYTYTWTGTENLSGFSSNIIKYYNTAGTKSAVVSIRSADGKTGTRACSNTVSVTSGTVAKKPTPTPTPCCYCNNQPCQYVPGKEGGAYVPPQNQYQPPVQPQPNRQVIYVLPNGQQVYADGQPVMDGQYVPVPIENVDSPGLFSLRNVPWGLVATLIILVLFFTVVYLIFNRTKI